MRILCERSSPYLRYVTTGWKNACVSAGYEFTEWVPTDKPAFDAFDETNPDIFIRTSSERSRAVEKCLGLRPATKEIVQVDPEHAYDPIAFSHFDLVWGYRPEMHCDVLFIANYKQSRRPLYDKHIIPLRDHFNLHVLGEESWPIPEYLGPVSRMGFASAIASATVTIDLGDHLDRPTDRWYTAAGLSRLAFMMIGAKVQVDITDDVRSAIEMKHGDRQRLIRDTREYVHQHHTYFDRVEMMFRHDGLTREADRIKEAKRAALSV